jgi:hypothetical protein
MRPLQALTALLVAMISSITYKMNNRAKQMGQSYMPATMADWLLALIHLFAMHTTASGD